MIDRTSDRRKTPYERRNLRPEAESKLAKTPAAGSPADMQTEKLLHEFQVHQIELEMQNDELRRAHLALEESRDQYLDLFEFAPVGYFTLTAAGLIAEVNFSGATLLDVERKKLLLRPLSRYIAPEHVDTFHLHMSRLSHQDEQQSYDLQIQRENGELRHVHLDAVRVQAEDDTVTLRLTLTDISELKQAEQELRIAATAFEAQEGILVTDTQHTILRVNKTFTRLTGYSAEEAVGKPTSLLSSGQHDAAFFQSMFETINRDHYWQGEIWNKRKNGEVFPALMTVTAVTGADGHTTHYVGSFLDITLQKKAEEVLLESRKQLEKQVKKTVAELNQLKEESDEVGTALKVMLKLRETESSDAKNLLILELKQEVMPFLQRLKNSSRDPKHVRLLSTLDANLQRLISSYGGATSITSAYKNLTPKEIQVASMVREGFATKTIAATLSLSPETISIHRKNIRKKLGLDSKADNLRSYLITLDK